jgi:hypothetical protein
VFSAGTRQAIGSVEGGAGVDVSEVFIGESGIGVIVLEALLGCNRIDSGEF